MRLILTLLIRDEIDIVESNIRYHLSQGVDHIIVTDNGSTDGTYDVVKCLASTGRVTLIREPPSDFSQHRWVTRMARIAYFDFGANWVINADADEIFAFSGGTLRDALHLIPPDVDTIRVNRTNFIPFDRPCIDSPFIEMIYRRAVSLNMAGNILPPKVLHRGAPDVVVSQGNHNATSPNFRGRQVTGDIEVFHYPVRSLPQLCSKVRNGGSGYALNHELDQSSGFHKRRWYDMLRNGSLNSEFYSNWFFSDGQLQKALNYGDVLHDRTIADKVKVLR